MGGRARAVFINCPFDPSYQPLFQAILFTVCAPGFEPRSALEVADSSDIRLEKIYDLIRVCPLAIHDISRTELDSETKLPRFNMPLELGIFLGAKKFGPAPARAKRCLIFAKHSHIKLFISDIAGLDIHGHGDCARNVINPIRHWLCTDAAATGVPASIIEAHFFRFTAELPSIFATLGFRHNEPQYGDLLKATAEWLETHPVNIKTSQKS